MSRAYNMSILPRVMKGLSSNPKSGSLNPRITPVIRFNVDAPKGEVHSVFVDLDKIRSMINIEFNMPDYYFYINSIKVYGGENSVHYIWLKDIPSGIACRDDGGASINRAAIGISYPPDARVIRHKVSGDGATKLYELGTRAEGMAFLVHISLTMWQNAVTPTD